MLRNGGGLGEEEGRVALVNPRGGVDKIPTARSWFGYSLMLKVRRYRTIFGWTKNQS